MKLKIKKMKIQAMKSFMASGKCVCVRNCEVRLIKMSIFFVSFDGIYAGLHCMIGTG